MRGMDARYPIPFSPDQAMPRFVAPGGVARSAAGTWVPLECAERLAERVRELEATQAEWLRLDTLGERALDRQISKMGARIVALEEENRELRKSVEFLEGEVAIDQATARAIEARRELRLRARE